MNVLKKLATPFVSIGRWIKETAWVQPLLIVGVIFAIIFSIPSITNWVSSWDFGDDTYSWLEKNQLSLEGVTDKEDEGEAASFFQTFAEAQVEWGNGNKDEARNIMNEYTGSSNKMFLFFYKEGDTSANINDAGVLLQESEWETKVVNEATKLYGDNAQNYIGNAGLRYNAIFTEEVIDVDDDDYTYEDTSAYEYLIGGSCASFYSFYSAMQSAYENSSYYQNLVSGKNTDTTVDTYEDNIDNFYDGSNYANAVPALVLIDLTDVNTTTTMITNIVFSFTGSNQYERSTFLANAWIYADDQFEKSNN